MEISNAKNHLFLKSCSKSRENESAFMTEFFLAAIGVKYPQRRPRETRLRKCKIRKVKAVSPSPFYDGKYHPPLKEQHEAAILK